MSDHRAVSAGRGVIAATVLGSGMAFLDGSVVNIALPTIGDELGGGLVAQQWILDGYLLSLSALLLLGGALGDRYGRRRVFLIGLVGFTIASLGCSLATTAEALVLARIAQGVGGALLVPGSLALINASFGPAERGRAVGTWAGLSGVASALGPFLGGWLVDAVGWRLVFAINLPVAAVAIWATLRYVTDSRSEDADGPPDFAGATAITLGLAGATYALIEVPAHGWTTWGTIAGTVGAVGLIGFPLLERRAAQPLLRLELFTSRQFVGVNLTTFAVYAALGGALFLLALQLQQSLNYSALAAGLATLPITVVMLLLSPRMGALAGRIGPRGPMTVGPIVAGVGLGLMSFTVPGADYWTVVLPAVVTFAIGLAITVAPLTSAVLASVDEEHVGAASGANNAISRLAGLIAVAVLPGVAGISASGTGPLGPGFRTAMILSGIGCAVGGLIAFLTVRRSIPVRATAIPGPNHACADPCTSRR